MRRSNEPRPLLADLEGQKAERLARFVAALNAVGIAGNAEELRPWTELLELLDTSPPGPSRQAALRRRLGCSKRTLLRRLARLRHAGLVVRRGHGPSSRYAVTVPRMVPMVPPTVPSVPGSFAHLNSGILNSEFKPPPEPKVVVDFIQEVRRPETSPPPQRGDRPASSDLANDWNLAVEGLRAVGLWAAQSVAAQARARGFHPARVLAAARVFAAHAGRWRSPGAIAWWLREHEPADDPAELAGWPPMKPADLRRQQRAAREAAAAAELAHLVSERTAVEAEQLAGEAGPSMRELYERALARRREG